MENIVRQNMNMIPASAPDIIQYDTPQIPLDSLQVQKPQEQVIVDASQPNESANVVQSESVTVKPDENGKTAADYLKEAGYYSPSGGHTNNNNSKLSKVERDKDGVPRETWNGVPIFQKAAEWTGETIKNTLQKRPIDLFTGAAYALTHPGKEIVQPLSNYAKEKWQEGQENPLLAVAEVLRDTSDMFVYKPFTGQSISEIVSQSPVQSLKNAGEHIHQGGLFDAYLMLLGTPAGKAINKGIGKGISKVDDIALKGKGKDFIKTKKAEKALRSETIIDKVEAGKDLRVFKDKLLDVLHEHKVTPNQMVDMIKQMEGFENYNLSQLPEKLKPVYQKLEPIIDEYDSVLQRMGERVPGNLTEIFQRVVRQGQARGVNLTYQAVKKAFEDSGLLDLGEFVDDTTGAVVKQNNALRALSEKPGMLPGALDYSYGLNEIGDVIKFDLSNTTFKIPEENLEILAQLALDASNPARAKLAKYLFESYKLADEGLLHRISHGLAQVDKTGEIAQLAEKGKRVKGNLWASERVYGNATAEDIAIQWLEPDNLFQYAIRGVVKDKLIRNWNEEFIKTGNPIINKNASMKDIVYITEDILRNGSKLHNLERYALKEIPKGADAERFIPIDKYTLAAYRNLFYPKSYIAQKLPWLKDLTTLFKQKLLAAGTYLGGNLLGGLHQLITYSNINLLRDISDAIKTRGELIKDLNLAREMPKANDIKMATDPHTKMGKALRFGHAFNMASGSHIIRGIDARMQNMFAEASAHTVFRKLGVKFENRNLEWLKANMDKETIYTALNDIEKMALIYGDATLIPSAVLDFMTLGNPFIRWIDQATQSSIHAMKSNPAAYGYLQGAVLGGLMWDKNEAAAKGLGIDNPQRGKIYKINPKTGESKAVEIEAIPMLSSLKAATPEGMLKLMTNSSKNATLGWAFNMLKANDEYGRLKERKYWKDIKPDYQRKVRYKNGIIQDTIEADEAGMTMLRETVLGTFANKMAAPLIYGALGKQSYQPYSDQFMAGPEGNPNKPYGPKEVYQRLLTEYEHDLIPGVDLPISPKKEAQLTKAMNKKQAKNEAKRQGLNGNN